MSACFGRCLLPKVVKIAGLWVMLYSGEKTTGYASGASGGSTPVAFPWWRLPPYHGGAEGRLRRPRRAGAMDKDSLSHTIRYCACHVVWIPRRRRKAPCGETEREVGEMPGMLAGAGMVGGAPAPTTHASASGLRPGAARATWWAGRGGMGATTPRERHHERGALTGRDRTMWARGYYAGTVGPDESVIRRHVQRQSDGSRTG